LAHVTPEIVVTTMGDYVQTLRIAGTAFEAADDVEINAWHEQLNALLRSIASPHVALWTHFIRGPARFVKRDVPAEGFAQQLIDKYGRRVQSGWLHVNEFYLSLLYRPVHGVPKGLFWGRGKSHSNDGIVAREAIDACEKLRSTIVSGLSRYEPYPLTCVTRDERRYSEMLEFLSLLLNGERIAVPLPVGPIHDALATSRLLFGLEAIEYRAASATRYGAVLGIKEYPTPTVPGMLNGLLSAPVSLVLSQSFSFLSKSAAQGLLQRQHLRMRNMGDFATSQAEALTAALDELTSNEFAMGDHHWTLQVLTESEDPSPNPAPSLKALNDAVAQVRSLVTDVGMVTAREDLALEAAFWAQFPGQFSLRPRKAPISTRNFAALSPWHTYPTGRRTGNHWGNATTVLTTRANSPYFFSLHASAAAPGQQSSRTDIGHTFVCGPTGSGKTVLIGFLVAAFSTQGVCQVLIDKDRGLDLLVRALGGTYLPLRNGLPTGLNPLALEPTPENVEFLRLWLELLLRREGSAIGFDSGEQADVEQALKGTMALAPAERRLSRLIEFLDPTAPNGPYARLAPWCASVGGERAWVFDNAVDEVAPTLSGAALMGFDVTDFLDHPVIRSPVTFYLFHLIRELLDGRRFVCWLDEFSRLLADDAFRKFAQDGPNSWRKLNAVMGLATQSARSVLESPISRSIVEQTPTKIFFPNPEALAVDYVDGLNLSEREYQLIRHQLVPGGRQFLLKQGTTSVVCELDLRGFAAELAVISGRADAVRFADRLRQRLGESVDQWLPAFVASIHHPDDKESI
jgi:type IV secretion system protein VirB4